MAASNQVKNEDETQIQETRGELSSPSICFQVMNSYGREFIFVIAIVFTAIAALQNGPLKTKKANPPRLFFTPPSLVTDFYDGNFYHMVSLLKEKDVGLVLYYAPWDASCMQAREEFETVAKFYHNEVYFAAINCWWPDGDCSKKFTIPAYPVIIAHIHDVGIIRYEGPIISNYIISYLDYVLSPLTPLQNTRELLDLLVKHEGVLVAYFQFKNGSLPEGYEQFYSASLRALTADPNRRMCFAVITNKKVATKFKLRSSIHLYLWNSTLIYSENQIKMPEVLKWAYLKLKEVSQWITPPGSKSRALSQVIENSAALILFTPRNLLLESSPYYDLFREVALDYYNCNKSSEVTSIIHRTVLKRHIEQEEFAKTIQKCHQNATTEHHPDVCLQRPDLCDLTCCQSLNLDLIIRKSCICRACLHHVVNSILEMKLFECEKTLDLVLKAFSLRELKLYENCHDVEVTFPVKFGQYKRLSIKCEDVLPLGSRKDMSAMDLTSMVSSEMKDDHILLMMQNNEKQKCHRLKYGLNYSELYFPHFPLSGSNAWQSNFTGLGCRTNRTLVFIAMDVVLFHAFAENLGIDILQNYHQSGIIISEATQESQYVMNGHIDKQKLVEFIKNYTIGSLNRYLRMPVRKLSKCHHQDGSSLCVDDVTTSTFTEVVLDVNKDVILLYYSSWCGPCSAIAHIFLSASDYFSNIKEIKFVRINGDDNDLPWEYTVERYPTIIFFPAKRKSASVVFPPNIEITTSNLLHFVLVHTQPNVRLVVAMEMCNRDCVAHNLVQSARELRLLFREHHVLLSDIQFIQELVNLSRDDKKSKKKLKITSLIYNTSESLSQYLDHMIDRIHRNRWKIRQALHLKSILMKKRTYFLSEAYLLKERQKANKHRDQKYNTGTFSKVTPKKSSKFTVIKKQDLKDEL